MRGLKRLRRAVPSPRTAGWDDVHALQEVVRSWDGEGPVISVITATRDRAGLLENALTSVKRQSWPHWQHVVVDDGSTDGTADLLTSAAAAEPRLRHVQGGHRGLAGARNLGQEAATGSVLVYLDDDNYMHPEWLRTVAWTFTTFAPVLAFGGRVIEDPSAISIDWNIVDAGPADRWPVLDLPTWDRARLAEGNYIDANTIAHRAGVPETRFDEQTDAASDYALVLQVAARYELLAVPAVACVYSTGAHGRMSQQVGASEDTRRVVARAADMLGLLPRRPRS